MHRLVKTLNGDLSNNLHLIKPRTSHEMDHFSRCTKVGKLFNGQKCSLLKKIEANYMFQLSNYNKISFTLLLFIYYSFSVFSNIYSKRVTLRPNGMSNDKKYV